ncbi:DNA-directed RNA polymerase subunit alpha C-terminal domain-containing protein [Bradyrhizobium sp. Ai1a-2]|uniref:DNA-directed RNA polymerase subunit alpha C-terminal domain-containing protein n=1 Tax=Bradyrhizobium sp. Ai1a-2 TaxID=196490 RepID=UPI0004847D46|nr:DNA-directed RNA polymerase subunit alpha C-terminal domain-containing protein [Bradyrhizobium sp. Ai1a-2]
MPVIRISDETYARLKKHAQPFEDTPESIIVKALLALEMMDGEFPLPVQPRATKRSDSPRLPQKEFRLPLLMTLLKFGGKAQAKDVRNLLGPIMVPKLAEGDFESVSTGDPRWWNAACWERSEMVKEGLMRDDSERGVWEISEEAKGLAATLNERDDKNSYVLARGQLHEMAARYWERPTGARPFVMVGEATFDPILLRRVNELSLSVRSENCLKNAGIIYIGDLVQRTLNDLVCAPNFGRKCVNEINEELARFNLRIGMILPGDSVKPFDGDAGV